jgi:hypothetical protein
MKNADREMNTYWIAMRNAAVVRHFWVWAWCGANPRDWPPYMNVIRAVFGF